MVRSKFLQRRRRHDQDRILDTGRHVLAKTSLLNRRKRALVPLGAHVFKDGTRK